MFVGSSSRPELYPCSRRSAHLGRHWSTRDSLSCADLKTACMRLRCTYGVCLCERYYVCVCALGERRRVCVAAWLFVNRVRAWVHASVRDGCALTVTDYSSFRRRVPPSPVSNPVDVSFLHLGLVCMPAPTESVIGRKITRLSPEKTNVWPVQKTKLWSVYKQNWSRY